MEINHSLIFNIALDFVIVTFSLLLIDRAIKRKIFKRLLQGSLFGVASIISMSFPVVIKSGTFIDTRTVFINLSTLLFGRTAGFITTVFAVSYRLYLGGEGVIGGTLLAFLAYIISLAFYFEIRKRPDKKLLIIYLASLITHIAMISFMKAFVPTGKAGKIAEKLMLPIVVFFPAITTFFAYIIHEHLKWRKIHSELETEKKFSETILNSVEEMIITSNTKYIITYVNKKTKIFFKKQKLIGENLFKKIKIYNRNDSNITEHLIEQAEKKGSIRISNCFLAKGLKKIPIEGVISCLYENQNEIAGFILSFLDITDKTEKQELLTDIMERISDGIESFDKNWNYTFANNQAAKLLNKKSPKELIGKNKWNMEPEIIGTPFYNACMQAQKTGKPVFMEHYYKPWKRWFENRIYPSKTGITIFFSDITERKKLEDELKRLNKHLNNIFELNPAIIFVWDPDTRKTLFVSKNIENVLGYSVEETYQDKWWRNIVHPEDKEKATENSDVVYVEGESTQKFRVYKKDGSMAWILERQIMIKEENKKTVFGVWLDITFMVEAEEKLLEEERKFKKLFNNSAVPMFLVEKESKKIVDSNPAASEMYGYSQKEFKGKSVFELHIEDDLNKSKKLRDNSYFLETIHKTKEGKKIFVEIYGIPIKYKGKEYIFAIIHDITKKKELEKSLIESEAKFFLAFKTIPIPIAITSVKEGKIIEVNEAFEKISKLKRENLVGKTTLELNFWQKEEDRQNFVKLLKEKQFIKNKQINFRNTKGEEVATLFSAALIKEEKSGEEFMIASFIDITEIKKLQNELETKIGEWTKNYQELREELKELENSLIRELEKPVNTLRKYSKLFGKEKDKEKIQTAILNSSSDIEKIVNELKNYSSLDNRLITLGKIPLEKIITNTLSLLKKQIKETNAEIIIPESLPIVYGNEEVLTKIFFNIIDNAIKFKKQEIFPIIEIFVEKESETFVQIAIIDNGIGIKKKYLNKIFLPFFKIHPDNSFEGIGMGLAFVKKAVNAIGGTISVDSEEGKGTTFNLFLTK